MADVSTSGRSCWMLCPVFSTVMSVPCVDSEFQSLYLNLLQDARAAGPPRGAGAPPTQTGLGLAAGDEQEYGTPVLVLGSGWAADCLRDPDRVDDRRAAVGPPLADYLASFAQVGEPPTLG